MIFNPKAVRAIDIKPKIFLTDFKIFNKSANEMLHQHFIHLDYGQNYFSFEYSAPDFSGHNLQYAYKLEGVDQDWVKDGRRNFASYSNLSGGTYTFKVRASNWAGVYENGFEQVTIIIKPPFWFEWWFYIIVVGFFAAAGYTFYRIQICQLIKRQAMRNGIAKDLHDHIGSTLSSISVYSKVAKIYYDQNKFEEMQVLLNTIGETAVEVVEEMADIVWSIDPQNDRLENLVQRIKAYAEPICMANHIVFSLHVNPDLLELDLPMGMRKNIFLILKESINNAIKYAKSETLQVNMFLENNDIIIKVIDKGIGYDQQLVSERQITSLSGNGLNNIKFRVNELNGNLNIVSSLGKGTVVEVRFKIP